MSLNRVFKEHKTLTVAWLALMVATLIAWALGQSAQGGGQASILAMAGVIITAFMKTWLIGFYFMELREAPAWLRHGYDLWNLVLCTALIAILTL